MPVLVQVQQDPADGPRPGSGAAVTERKPARHQQPIALSLADLHPALERERRRERADLGTGNLDASIQLRSGPVAGRGVGQQGRRSEVSAAALPLKGVAGRAGSAPESGCRTEPRARLRVSGHHRLLARRVSRRRCGRFRVVRGGDRRVARDHERLRAVRERDDLAPSQSPGNGRHGQEAVQIGLVVLRDSSNLCRHGVAARSTLDDDLERCIRLRLGGIQKTRGE